MNTSQVEPDQKASFYKSVRARLVKTIQADSTGYFEASLDTGSYSLFIKVDNAYYANLRDQFNHLAPIRVQAGRVADIDLLVLDLRLLLTSVETSLRRGIKRESDRLIGGSMQGGGE